MALDDDGHGAERIIFPVRGREGELYGYTGRAIDEDVQPRIRDYYGLPKRACLLGLDALLGNQRTIFRDHGGT